MNTDTERQKMRAIYRDAWMRFCNDEPLEPMQKIIADTIAEHPEYHAMIENEDSLQTDFTVEDGQTNPFLHMGLHIAIHEQLTTDRPAGIRKLYQSLQAKSVSTHETEHAIMDCLAEGLWEAQRQGKAPDDVHYLECIRKLL